MITENLITSFSFSNLTSGLVSTGPFMSLYFVLQQSFQPPASVAAQTWILTAIGAAMGLVKIALWLRGEKKENGNGNVSKVLERLAENQQKIAENHGKILEALTAIKVMNEAQQEFLKIYLEKIATESVEELKDFLRTNNG